MTSKARIVSATVLLYVVASVSGRAYFTGRNHAGAMDSSELSLDQAIEYSSIAWNYSHQMKDELWKIAVDYDDAIVGDFYDIESKLAEIDHRTHHSKILEDCSVPNSNELRNDFLTALMNLRRCIDLQLEIQTYNVASLADEIDNSVRKIAEIVEADRKCENLEYYKGLGSQEHCFDWFKELIAGHSMEIRMKFEQIRNRSMVNNLHSNIIACAAKNRWSETLYALLNEMKKAEACIASRTGQSNSSPVHLTNV